MEWDKVMRTWKEKGDWENKHCPAHAEGYACAPGSLILIKDKKGKYKLIPFNPETLSLDTKILDWHPNFNKQTKTSKMCLNCSNYICKAYDGTCRKYRIVNFFKRLITKRK